MCENEEALSFVHMRSGAYHEMGDETAAWLSIVVDDMPGECGLLSKL